jgi:glycosyltransferase involved in cell wall biosynthesis
VSKNIIWPDNSLLKLYNINKGRILTLFKIISEHQKKPIDVLISASTYKFAENLPYYLLSKIIRARLLLTIDEYPWVLINKENYSSFYRFLHLKFYYKLFDGFIAITETLTRYYLKLTKSKAKFYHLPMTVEFERFENVSLNKFSSDYIAYCGNDPTGTKDGVNMLIEAFDIIKDDFPELKLLIAGKVHQLTHKYVKDMYLENRVVFLGFIERDFISEILMNAKALCLSRPKNFQAEGGFPTKLGEYLATGRPVVITEVGEITEYLTDGISAFIAKPDDVRAYADKLKSCLLDSINADRIGSAGRQVALQRFNYSNYSNGLHNFVLNL